MTTLTAGPRPKYVTHRAAISPQRYDRAREHLRESFADLLAVPEMLAVMLTEMPGSRMGEIVDLIPKGGGFFRASDCAVVWTEGTPVEMSAVRYDGKWMHKSGFRGRPLETPVVALRLADGTHHVFAGMHLPAGTEKRFARGTLSRQRASRQHANDVRREVNRLRKKYARIERRALTKAQRREHRGVPGLIGADWNLNFLLAPVRAFFRATFPNWKGWQAHLVHGLPGTHGSRLIDMILSIGPVRRIVVRVRPRTAASDHRTLVLTYQTPAPL